MKKSQKRPKLYQTQEADQDGHYQDDITQRLSKLTRLIQVMESCKNFMNTCPQTKDSRHTTTLSMQEIENALTCCMKMVWISYVKETRF